MLGYNDIPGNNDMLWYNDIPGNNDMLGYKVYKALNKPGYMETWILKDTKI